MSKSPHWKLESDYPRVSVTGKSVVLEFRNMNNARNVAIKLSHIFSLLIESNIDINTFFDDIFDDYELKIPEDEISFYKRMASQKLPSGVY